MSSDAGLDGRFISGGQDDLQPRELSSINLSLTHMILIFSGYTSGGKSGGSQIR